VTGPPLSPGPEAGPVTPAAAPLSTAALFLRFLRFGLIAWGGPVAQVAMIRRELVEQQAWVSAPRFNRMLAVFQILPGPEAHELCVHLGMIRGGRAGGIAAGLGFMLPGLVLMLLASWLYFRLDIAGGALGPVFLGVQFAVLARNPTSSAYIAASRCAIPRATAVFPTPAGPTRQGLFACRFASTSRA